MNIFFDKKKRKGKKEKQKQKKKKKKEKRKKKKKREKNLRREQKYLEELGLCQLNHILFENYLMLLKGRNECSIFVFLLISFCFRV